MDAYGLAIPGGNFHACCMETPTPLFTGIGFFVYPVTDMARARAFYAGVLGLKETGNWENKWVEYDIGTTTLALTSFLEGATPGQAGAAGLETDAYDTVVERLRANGVKFVMEPMDTGVCRFARFLDTEGNHLVLHRKHTHA
jgi:predicted enzyme related to lactoylglutathione lyase